MAKYNPLYHRGLSSFRAVEDLFPGTDNYVRYMAGRVPLVSDLAKFYDSNKMMSDYMRNRGLSWSDVKYPSMVFQGGNFGSLRQLDAKDYSYQALYDVENPFEVVDKWNPMYG